MCVWGGECTQNSGSLEVFFLLLLCSLLSSLCVPKALGSAKDKWTSWSSSGFPQSMCAAFQTSRNMW